MTTAIDRLIELDRVSPRRIFVAGDTMLDVWIHGKLLGCQDSCPRFLEHHRKSTPGGAANAARQLRNWHSEASLVAPWPLGLAFSVEGLESFNDFDTSLVCSGLSRVPVKERFLDGGKIVFRRDTEDRCYGAGEGEMRECREQALKHLVEIEPAAVLLADYDKGFLDGSFVGDVVRIVYPRDAPIVSDAKRRPSFYYGTILKCNADYYVRYEPCPRYEGLTGVVATNGDLGPLTTLREGRVFSTDHGPHVACVNHVGAGDCFAAHLTLALAHGLNLMDAVTIAHAAGRVYVQHRHSRPPWPHEIRKDLDPVGGKVIPIVDLPALRQSIPGRIVFTNGVFRLPHAGHAWLLRYAKQQGGTLVVGVNDDASASGLRNGQYVMPLQERLQILASLDCVDWVIPFTESDPVATMRALKPDVLVKGHEYVGQRVPGDDLVREVLFAPESPFPKHSTDVIAGWKENAHGQWTPHPLC